MAQDINVYIELHETVLAYKHGDKSASAKIIESFNGFLWRYVNLIHKGVFRVEDTSLRKFISLFYPSSGKSELSHNQYGYKKSVHSKLTNSALKIKHLFDGQYTETEIRNELIGILLNMAKKYSDYDRPSFHTYVERCFHFEAFRGLEHLITDPISRQDYEEYVDCFKCDDSTSNFANLDYDIDKSLSIKYSKIPVPVVSDNFSIFDDETLNDNWITGITCSDVFSVLTPFERRILIEHNVNKKTDSEISLDFGLCRATINRRRLGAVSKLKEALNIK